MTLPGGVILAAMRRTPDGSDQIMRRGLLCCGLSRAARDIRLRGRSRDTNLLQANWKCQERMYCKSDSYVSQLGTQN